MTTDTIDRKLVWIVLAIIAALVVVPAVGMGFGMMGTGPMMGGAWGDHMWGASGASGWMLVFAVVMQLGFLAVLFAAVYLGYQALTTQADSSDPALEELRSAYARGDLSDEEYERRRERLESDS
ncbi:SHOCT domain-containing protein [Natronomonas salina]|uniref:SHOCT domain-containing protein n=1 Tax=Natronomonas salina TaxID=1710540 RepID=UPI0015B62E0F|nr:SHOCT domain-containing protein [Natronomonas salina]QLD89596.1 SHOCT domain-containing protein [Natronomonas salina]